MLSRYVLLLIDKVNPIHPLSTLKKWSPIESGYDCFHCMMPYTKHSTHNITVFVIEATHSNYSLSANLVINRQNNTTKSNREQFTWFAWCILKTKVKYVFYREMKMNWKASSCIWIVRNKYNYKTSVCNISVLDTNVSKVRYNDSKHTHLFSSGQWVCRLLIQSYSGLYVVCSSLQLSHFM